MKQKFIFPKWKTLVTSLLVCAMTAQSMAAIHPAITELLNAAHRNLPSGGIPLSQIPIQQITPWDINGGTPLLDYEQARNSATNGNGNVWRIRLEKLKALKLDPESLEVLRTLITKTNEADEAVKNETAYAALRKKYQAQFLSRPSKTSATTAHVEVSDAEAKERLRFLGSGKAISVGLLVYGATYFASKWAWYNRFGMRPEHERIGFQTFLESEIGQFSWQSFLIIGPLVAANLFITFKMLRTATAQKHPISAVLLASAVAGFLNQRVIKGLKATIVFKEAVAHCGLARAKLHERMQEKQLRSKTMSEQELEPLTKEASYFAAEVVRCHLAIRNDFWAGAREFSSGVIDYSHWQEDLLEIGWGAAKFGVAIGISKSIKSGIIGTSKFLDDRKVIQNIGESLYQFLHNRAVYQTKIDESIMYNVAKTMNIGRWNVTLPSIGLAFQKTKEALISRPIAKVSGAVLGRMEMPATGALSPQWLTTFIKSLFGKYTSVVFDAAMLAFTMVGIDSLNLEQKLPHFYQTHFNYSLGERLDTSWTQILSASTSLMNLDEKNYSPDDASARLETLRGRIESLDQVWSQYRDAEIIARLKWEEDMILSEILARQKQEYSVKNYFDLHQRLPDAPNWSIKEDKAFRDNGGSEHLEWHESDSQPVALDQEINAMRNGYLEYREKSRRTGKSPYQLFLEGNYRSRERIKVLQDVRLKGLMDLTTQTYVGRQRDGYVTNADAKARTNSQVLYANFSSPGNLKAAYLEEMRLTMLNWAKFLEQNKAHIAESPESQELLTVFQKYSSVISGSNNGLELVKIYELRSAIDRVSFISRKQISEAPSTRADEKSDFPFRRKSVRISLMSRIFANAIYKTYRALENNEMAYHVKLKALDLTQSDPTTRDWQTQRDSLIHTEVDQHIRDVIVGTVSKGLVYTKPKEEEKAVAPSPEEKGKMGDSIQKVGATIGKVLGSQPKDVKIVSMDTGSIMENLNKMQDDAKGKQKK